MNKTVSNFNRPMRQTYTQPQMEVVEMEYSQMLAASARGLDVEGEAEDDWEGY